MLNIRIDEHRQVRVYFPCYQLTVIFQLPNDVDFDLTNMKVGEQEEATKVNMT